MRRVLYAAIVIKTFFYIVCNIFIILYAFSFYKTFIFYPAHVFVQRLFIFVTYYLFII